MGTTSLILTTTWHQAIHTTYCQVQTAYLNQHVTLLGTWPTFFFLFLDHYVLIWSHDLDSHDWLPVHQSHLVRNPIVPSFLYVLHCSPFIVARDHHCSWLYCSVTLIVRNSIVLPICMLSQVAALLYISWAYILELGLKPDLVCNLLHSKSLLLDKLFPLFISLELSSNPWRQFPFLFIFTQTLVLATLLLLSPSKAL